ERQEAGLHDTKVDLDLGALLVGDVHHTPATRESFEIAHHIIPAHHVEYHVDPFPLSLSLDDLDEIFASVVDRAARAELDADGAFLWASGGGEDLVPARGHELDRRRADAARTAMHQ